MLDAVTDIFVISKYYKTEGLRGQANAMIAMIVTNMVIQILIVLGQYKKKSWKVKVKEVLISLFLLRPIVDAFRVSTNYQDNEATFDPLVEMIINKVRCEMVYTQIFVVTAPSSLSINFMILNLFRRAGCRAWV